MDSYVMQVLLFPTETEVCYVFTRLCRLVTKLQICLVCHLLMGFHGLGHTSGDKNSLKVAVPDARSNMWQVMVVARCFVTADSRLLPQKQILT